jgi:hypothetical protein
MRGWSRHTQSEVEAKTNVLILLAAGVVLAFVLVLLVLLKVLEYAEQIAIGVGAGSVGVAIAYFVLMRPSPKKPTHFPTLIADVKPGLVHTAGLVGFTEQARPAPSAVRLRLLSRLREDRRRAALRKPGPS